MRKMVNRLLNKFPHESWTLTYKYEYGIQRIENWRRLTIRFDSSVIWVGKTQSKSYREGNMIADIIYIYISNEQLFSRSIQCEFDEPMERRT